MGAATLLSERHLQANRPHHRDGVAGSVFSCALLPGRQPPHPWLGDGAAARRVVALARPAAAPGAARRNRELRSRRPRRARGAGGVSFPRDHPEAGPRRFPGWRPEEAGEAAEAAAGTDWHSAAAGRRAPSGAAGRVSALFRASAHPRGDDLHEVRVRPLRDGRLFARRHSSARTHGPSCPCIAAPAAPVSCAVHRARNKDNASTLRGTCAYRNCRERFSAAAWLKSARIVHFECGRSAPHSPDSDSTGAGKYPDSLLGRSPRRGAASRPVDPRGAA